ncbi:MAG: hypothetical protein JWM10_4439 [Myxococcaceae bacterium]|nr:hypothetical protein [Myxococcaceae bacterium]
MLRGRAVRLPPGLAVCEHSGVASLKIRLVETASGPQILVDYESDPGALAHEHEADHRRAVAQLLGLTEDEMTAQGIVVTRGGATADEAPARAGEPGQARAAVPSKG